MEIASGFIQYMNMKIGKITLAFGFGCDIINIMFGRRADGKRIKGINGMLRMTPLLMRTREGATNYFKLQQDMSYFDNYIAKKRKEGIEYCYRDLVIAILVRVFKMRPRLNRFIIASKFYQRKIIDVAMIVHKSLRTGEDETVVKGRFTGYETLPEAKAIMDKEIAKAVRATNDADAQIDIFEKLPFPLLRGLSWIFRLFDHWGLLSDKFLQDNSPFHSSIFLTDLKSIKMDYVYHHLYNFGNCGFFIALGKEENTPVVDDDGKIVVKKIMELGISVDERYVDGLYFRRMIKDITRMVENLELLERPLEEDEIHHEKTYKQMKTERKNKKKDAKKKKKENKKARKQEKRDARIAKRAA